MTSVFGELIGGELIIHDLEAKDFNDQTCSFAKYSAKSEEFPNLPEGNP
ncbi:MAG: hypothetical protein HN494_12895 [Opitutae bacterium]|jgi:hypothetical protein|nr:hypothetical protein [Opitutae bacterium]MBT5909744.1 hypothetical protein [Opitutae bacterium]MBT6851550.1 hypothetical protein [Opitutae bacterium]MBT7743068.1 hypothetical protein [Opitutae bacterium]MBT7922729.1 hypothetical protein [Opitutae bacterium]